MRIATAAEKPSKRTSPFTGQDREDIENIPYNLLLWNPFRIGTAGLLIWEDSSRGISAAGYNKISSVIDDASASTVSGISICLAQRPPRYTEGFTSFICSIPQVAITSEAQFLWAESATAKEKKEEEIESKVFALFEAADAEVFEDGIENRFSQDLISLITSLGNAAVKSVADIIISGHANPEVASEALRWIGRLDNPQSSSNRLWLLESCLNCDSAKTRDGAILGLASMDDPKAIPYIKNAMERETLSELKKDMQQVIDQLENTNGAIHFAEGKKKSLV